jgi:hypothetical protein
MHLHGALQALMQVLQVGKIAVDEVVGHLAVLFDPEVEKDVGSIAVPAVFGSQLDLEPPL